jgi:hypothetical protein
VPAEREPEPVPLPEPGQALRRGRPRPCRAAGPAPKPQAPRERTATSSRWVLPEDGGCGEAQGAAGPARHPDLDPDRPMDIAQANDEFGIDGILHLRRRRRFPLITIDNEHARAEICTYAGQVLSYQPRATPDDLLFVSDTPVFSPARPSRAASRSAGPGSGRTPRPRVTGPDHGFVRAGSGAAGHRVHGRRRTRVRLGCQGRRGQPRAVAASVRAGDRGHRRATLAWR